MKQFDQPAKDLFATHKDADVLYFTTDGNAFFDLLKTQIHTQRLKDKSIVDVYRNGQAKQRVEALLSQQKAEQLRWNEIGITASLPGYAKTIKENAAKKKP